MRKNLFMKVILACTFLIGGITPAWSDAEYSITDVFVSGTEGYNTFRIPAIVKAADGTLLAFCEGRKTSSTDEGDIDIVLKRSTNNGLTWGSLILVQEEGGNADITIGNPAPVVDTSTGYIHLLFCRENSTVFHTVSTDNGLTWSTRTEITDAVKLPNWSWYATGPCHGVQLTRGDQAGRLVVPANHTIWNASTSSMENGAHIIYSDDHGVSWRLGAYFEMANGSAPNETTIVELNTPGDDGTGSHIYINSRDYGTDAGTRAEAWSGDGGRSYSVPYDGNSHFYTPICQGSLLRFSATDEGDSMNRIIYSGPSGSTTYRVDGSLWTSTDEAVSWSSPKLLFSGSFSYSDMAVTDTGHLGILAECNATGSYTAYIKFIRINEEWMDEPPPPTLPVVVDVDFSNFPAGSTIADGTRVQDNSGSDHHGFWGDASGSYSIVSTSMGVGIDTTTSDSGHIFLRDGMSITENWFTGTTPIPYFTLLAASNYTFEAVVNFNGRSWDGAGKDGLMGQTGGNEAYIRTENGFLQYTFVGNGVDASQWNIDIKSAYDGEFHAIAVVLDRTAGEIRAYLDGELLHTNTDADITALGEMLSGTSDFRLGAYNTTDADAFNGVQDRYRISSFARDPAGFLQPEPSSTRPLPVVVDVNFSNFSNVSTLADGDRVQDSSGNGYHGFWGDAVGDYNIVSTGSGFGIDTTTSDSGNIFLRDGLSVSEDWFTGTTPTPYFTLLAASNYTFEAVVNFNGRSWDGAGKDGLMGQTGANEAYIRTENGNLQYRFASDGIGVNQWNIDIKAAYDGEFHSIAVVLDRAAGEIRAYLDGELLHTNTDSNIPLLGEMLDGTSDFRLGAYNATGVDAFNGLQDRYRISSYARDPEDLLPPDPSASLYAAVLTISVDSDQVTVAATNLSDSAGVINTLQMKESLLDGSWSNLYSVSGVTEAIWILATTNQCFYRTESSY